MSNLGDMITGEAGDAFRLYCDGRLGFDAMGNGALDEFAACARYWLDIPAIANATGADSSLPAFLTDFIAACDAELTRRANDDSNDYLGY